MNDTSNDCISRQAAIDTEGLDEQIKCEMCRNPMHTVRGCDGNCKYDEKLYERIMQILDKRIKPLPSAQPYLQQTCNQLATDAISRQAAVDALIKADYEFTGILSEPRVRMFEQTINALPSAQSEQKVGARKGRWIKHNTGHSVYFDCSLCGCLAPSTETEDKFLWELSNYCPDCGADMRDKEGAQE